MAPLALLALIAAGGALVASASKKAPASKPDLRVPSELYQRAIAACQKSDPAAIFSVMTTIASNFGQTMIGMLLAIVKSDIDSHRLPPARSEPSATQATTDLIALMLAKVTEPALLVRYAAEFDKARLPVSANRLRDGAKKRGDQSVGLPPELQAMVTHAQELGTPEAYSSAAYSLEQAGYTETAKVLREKATQLSRQKGTPPASQQPAHTTDPGMGPELSAEVSRILRDSADPKVLRTTAQKIRAMGYGPTADQLDAKATQIEAAAIAANAMNQVQTVLNQGVPTARFPDGTGPVLTPASGTVEAPSPPSIVIPKSAETVAAENMVRQLLQLANKYGGIKKAKPFYAKEASGVVKKFQALRGALKPDGLYGPKTALDAAKFTDTLAPVWYWPKNATSNDVHTFLSNIETLALEADARSDVARAVQLRAYAKIEQELGVGPGERGLL